MKRVIALRLLTQVALEGERGFQTANYRRLAKPFCVLLVLVTRNRFGLKPSMQHFEAFGGTLRSTIVISTMMGGGRKEGQAACIQSLHGRYRPPTEYLTP